MCELRERERGGEGGRERERERGEGREGGRERERGGEGGRERERESVKIECMECSVITFSRTLSKALDPHAH